MANSLVEVGLELFIADKATVVFSWVIYKSSIKLERWLIAHYLPAGYYNKLAFNCLTRVQKWNFLWHPHIV